MKPSASRLTRDDEEWEGAGRELDEERMEEDDSDKEEDDNDDEGGVCSVAA